jgi:hypothetical protein
MLKLDGRVEYSVVRHLKIEVLSASMSISVVGGNVDKLRSSSRASSLLLLPRDKSEFRCNAQACRDRRARATSSHSMSRSTREVFGICGQCRTFHPIEVYMESMKLTPGLDSHKKLEYFHSLHHINLCTYA